MLEKKFIAWQFKEKNAANNDGLPALVVWSVLAVCVLPSLLNLIGYDFGSLGLPASSLLQSSRADLVDNAHFFLAGALTHTILEWSAFCAALFTVVLAFAHYYIKHDVVTPIIAVALFCAGIMDAFHTLAAGRLIDAVADNENLIPFTWALCRIFNGMIMLIGVTILIKPHPKERNRTRLIMLVSLAFGLAAYGLIHWSATSTQLPQTMYPGSVIARPFDVLPLLLFAVLGLYVYPRIYRRSPSLFTQALVISALPEVVVEIHMAFGSTTLFDNHFNIAHFLKVVAYVVPFIGLCLDYVRTYQAELTATRNLIEAQKQLEEYADSLEVKVETRSRELKASQQQLIHSEKMASVGLLAAGVAHEINNPTGFVMSNLEVLRGYKINLQKLFLGYQELTSYVAEGNTDSNREEIKASLQKLKVIEEEGDIQYIMEDLDSLLDDSLLGTQRIQKIVQDLKSFSRVDDSEKKFVDLNEEVIEIALRLVWNEIKYKCTLKKELMPLPRFECRPGQLSQVIMNLLINASDAIETNGEITLSSECADSMIIIKVTDDGMGIAQKEMLNIFDPFFTTKESGKGTGLGLSISHDIVKKHTGEILVSSELGEGTTFSIHLPLNSGSRDYTGRQTEWKA